MSQDQDNHIDAAIADLESWLERITTAIGTLKYFRSQGGSLPAMQPSLGTRTSANGEISHDTFFKMTIPDAAEKDLKLAKKTKTTLAIAESLLKGGLKSSSKNFASMVKTVLSRDSRFVKVNKEWGLDEWYPGMKRGSRVAATGDKPAESKAPELVKKTIKVEVDKNTDTTIPVKTRALTLINSQPSEVFTAKKMADALKHHPPTVKAALATMFAAGLIARPRPGEYQSLKTA